MPSDRVRRWRGLQLSSCGGKEEDNADGDCRHCPEPERMPKLGSNGPHRRGHCSPAMGSWADELRADVLLNGSGSGFSSGLEAAAAACDAAADPSGPAYINVGPRVSVLSDTGPGASIRSHKGARSLGAGMGRALRHAALLGEYAIVFIGSPGSTSPLVGTALAATVGAAVPTTPGAGQARFSGLHSAVSDCHALLCAFTCAAGPTPGADSAPLPGRLQHTCLWSVGARPPRLDGRPSPPSVSVDIPLVSRSAAGSQASCARCWAATLFAALHDEPAARKRQRAKIESGRDALRRLCGRARLDSDETDRLLAAVNACMRLSEVRWYVLPGQQSPAVLADEPAVRALRAAAANLCLREEELRTALSASAADYSPAAAADEVYSLLLGWLVGHVNRVLQQAADDEPPADAAAALASTGPLHGPVGEAGWRRVLLLDVAQPGGAGAGGGDGVADPGLDGLLASLLCDGVSALTATQPCCPHGEDSLIPSAGACDLEVELISAAQRACAGLCGAPSLLVLQALAPVAEASARASRLAGADAAGMQRAQAQARALLLSRFGVGRGTGDGPGGGARPGGGGGAELELRPACGGQPACYALSGAASVRCDGSGRGGAGLLDQAEAAWHTSGGATSLQDALRRSSSAFVVSLLRSGAGPSGLAPGRAAAPVEAADGPPSGIVVCPWATLPGRAASVLAALARLSACDQLRTVVCGLAGGKGQQASAAVPFDPVAWLAAQAQRALDGRPYSAPVSSWQSRYECLLPSGARRSRAAAAELARSRGPAGAARADDPTIEALLHALGPAAAGSFLSDGQLALTVGAMRAAEERLAIATSLAVDMQARATAAELESVRAKRRQGASCIQATWRGHRDRRAASHLWAARAARLEAVTRLAVARLQAHARGLAARAARRRASAACTLQSATRGRAGRRAAAAARFTVAMAPARRTLALWLGGWLVQRRLARLRRSALAIQTASRAAIHRWHAAGIRPARAEYHQRRHAAQRQLLGLWAQVAAAEASGGHAKALRYRLAIKEYQARLGRVVIADALIESRRWMARAGGGSPRPGSSWRDRSGGGSGGSSGAAPAESGSSGSAPSQDGPTGGPPVRQCPPPAVSVSLDCSPPLGQPLLVERASESGAAATPTVAAARPVEEVMAGVETALGLSPESDVASAKAAAERAREMVGAAANTALHVQRAAGRDEHPEAGQAEDGASAAAPWAGVRVWAQADRQADTCSVEGIGAVAAAGAPAADAIPAETREALRTALAAIEAHGTDLASLGEPFPPRWRGGGVGRQDGLDERTLSLAVGALRAEVEAGQCSEPRRYALRKKMRILRSQLRKLQDDREQVERACAARRPRGRDPRPVTPHVSHAAHAAARHAPRSGPPVDTTGTLASLLMGTAPPHNCAAAPPAGRPALPSCARPAGASAHYSADAAAAVRGFLQTGRWVHHAPRRCRPSHARAVSSPAPAPNLRSPPRNIECSPTQKFELRSSPSKQRPGSTNRAMAVISPAPAPRLRSPPRRIECSPTQKFELRSSPSKRRARSATALQGAAAPPPAAPSSPAAPVYVREHLRYSRPPPTAQWLAEDVPSRLGAASPSRPTSLSADYGRQPAASPIGPPRRAARHAPPAWAADRPLPATHSSPSEHLLPAPFSRGASTPPLAHRPSSGEPQELGAPKGGNSALRRLAPPSFHGDAAPLSPGDARRSTPLRPPHRAPVVPHFAVDLGGRRSPSAHNRRSSVA